MRIPVYATQGGGKAIWDKGKGKMVFLKVPNWAVTMYRPGDAIPEEWGYTGPIEKISQTEVDEMMA